MPPVVAPVAVYRLYDADAVLLYVGMTRSPHRRWRVHSADKPWWGLVARTSIEWCDSPESARKAELAAIRAEQPMYNIDGTGRATATPRTGRPKTDNPRTNAVPIRLSDGELAQLRSAAEKAGVTVGEYVRSKALAAAKRSR